MTLGKALERIGGPGSYQDALLSLKITFITVATGLPSTHFRSMVRFFCISFLGVALAAPGMAAPLIDDDAPNAEPVVDNEAISRRMQSFTASAVVRASNERVQRDAESLIPLHFSDDGNRLFFANLVHNLRDGGEVSFSAGAGVRFFLPGNDSVLGFHVLGDNTETLSDNDISQLGLGFDLFTPSGIDVHGNLYLPESDDHVAREFLGYGDLFATGNTIFQTENLLTIFERGRKGADIKVKFDVPLLSEVLPTRGHIGAYHFDGDYGDDLTGAMAGIMVQPFHGAAFGAEYYGDDEFFGDHWVFVAGVSGPIEFDALVKPQKLLAGIARAFSVDPTPRDRSADGMREFLTHRIDRRNWVLQEWSAPTVTQSTDLVIEDDIIFVNNISNGVQVRDRGPSGSAGGRGTFEDPVDTIQAGVDRAAARFGNDGTVLVAGTGRTYREEVVDAGRGFHLRSGHLPYVGRAGETFSYGNQANLDGGVIVDNVANFSLSGFDVRNGALSLANPDAVFVSNVRDIAIVGNTIRNAAQDGIDIEVSGTTMSTAIVRRNRVFGSSDDTYDIDVVDSAKLEIVYEDNISRRSGSDGVNIDVDNDGTLDLVWTGGGIFDSDGDGFYLDADDDARATILFRDTTVSGTGIDGFSINADEDVIVSATVSRVAFSDTDIDGVYLDAAEGAGVFLAVRNSTFMDIPDVAVDLEIFDEADVVISIVGNEIRGSSFAAVEIDLGDEAALRGRIAENAVKVDTNGFGLFLGDDTVSRVSIIDNDVQAGTGTPLFMPVFGIARAGIQIANNRFASGAGTGLTVLSDDAADLDLQFFGNTLAVDADFEEIGGVFELENPLGSNAFNGGSNLLLDPNIDIVPFGTFGFPDPR